jgi:hypothetical protein
VVPALGLVDVLRDGVVVGRWWVVRRESRTILGRSAGLEWMGYVLATILLLVWMVRMGVLRGLRDLGGVDWVSRMCGM